MSDYTYPNTGFTLTQRDALAPGDPDKTVKGVQLEPEFTRLATVSAEKLNAANPAFTGIMTGGTIDGGAF